MSKNFQLVSDAIVLSTKLSSVVRTVSSISFFEYPLEENNSTALDGAVDGSNARVLTMQNRMRIITLIWRWWIRRMGWIEKWMDPVELGEL